MMKIAPIVGPVGLLLVLAALACRAYSTGTPLSAKFGIREFHHAVLREGTLPLELLKEVANQYVSASRQ
jgi:uncharacterized protein (DUF885 family)